MAERKQKFERRPVLDPAVADLLSNMEEKQIEAQMPRREREKKRASASRSNPAANSAPPTTCRRPCASASKKWPSRNACRPASW